MAGNRCAEESCAPRKVLRKRVIGGGCLGKNNGYMCVGLLKKRVSFTRLAKNTEKPSTKTTYPTYNCVHVVSAQGNPEESSKHGITI